MFTIMESRKRRRLEMNNTSNNSSERLQGVASAAAMGMTTLATIGGQSFILSNSTTSSLPASILLSICDDNSNESEEYILDHSLLTPIKQEETVATQTTCSQTLLQQTSLVNGVPQYRVVNQAGKPLNSTSLNSSSIIDSTTLNANNNSLMSNSVHLPPGCEIYVVKEIFEPPKPVIAESTNTINTDCKALAASDSTIKIEPISPLPLRRHTSANGNNNQIINSNSTITVNATSHLNSTCNTSSISSDDNAKRSLILEAYKKRDDKRRATHNEVERRRRDKINSWIFKLKEMLPTETTNCNTRKSLTNKDAITVATLSSINQNNTSRLLAHQQGSATTTRTPPSDSKSQILIKACEYIKSMQEEINSLRECLTDNENLRSKNQRLQDEINNLRTKQRQHNSNNILLTTNTTNNINNCNDNSDNSDNCEITLNSLNTTYANVHLFAPSTNQNNNHHHLADLVGLPTDSNTKRELIITDYVD